MTVRFRHYPGPVHLGMVAGTLCGCGCASPVGERRKRYASASCANRVTARRRKAKDLADLTAALGAIR